MTNRAAYSVVRPTPPPRPWAEDLFTYGVTGTNGKTSTVWLLEHAVAAAGLAVARVSTVGDAILGESVVRPEGQNPFLRLMERAHAAGCRHAVVEVTSLSLANHYAKFWRFDLGVFTNLSPDHLKTHGSWEAYLAAKAQLFTHLGPGRSAVLNGHDEHAVMLDVAIPPDVNRVWFGSPTRGERHHPVDVAAREVEVSLTGTRARLEPSPLAERLGGQLETRMVGEVFLENALAAAAAALVEPLDGNAVARGLAACPAVPGRFEVCGVEPALVVDYAHSEDALERTLTTARRLARGAVWVVFGAGGSSTPSKREPMGRVAGRLADGVVLTNDNPRDEAPEVIVEALARGVRAAGREPEIVLDRRAAILRAAERAKAGDVVVIAGKGAESGQHIGDRIEPFSDRDEVLRLVAGRS